MKHLIKILGLMVFAGIARAADAPKTWALIVGVGAYQNPQISPLRFAAKDAISLRDAMLSKEIVGLPRDQVKMLADNEATRDNIMGAAENFFKNVQKGDKVVVFMAGHGVAKGVGTEAKSYFLPTDAKGLTRESLANSAVDLRAFADSLGALPAAQFAVFVDACREDPTPGRGIKGNALSDVLSRGLTISSQDPDAKSATLFACSVGQRAYEDANLGHGVFTNWILDGLIKANVPEKEGDVDIRRLARHVSEKVEAWAEATSKAGDFEVTQTPELVAARPLDTPLIFLKVNRRVSGTPVPPAPPKIIIAPPAAFDANDPAAKAYKKATDAAALQQWGVAELAYKAAIEANPQFIPAHDGLIELHRLQGRHADTIADALNLLNNASNPHALALLSRAYSRFAEMGAGKGNTVTKMAPVKKYFMPRDAKQALTKALEAANEAIALDKKSAEANRALGYALATLDAKGTKKAAALAAFSNAVVLDDADPANQLALGYGYRFYGVQQKDETARQEEVKQAIPSLEQAVKLRPDYYEAHRELAFCYTLLGNPEKALKECELANANRGAASSAVEIAALDVAAAGMHQKAAENSTGEKKEGHQAASQGYMAEAREHDPELKAAMSLLNTVGVSTSLYSYLPAEVSKWLNPADALKNEVGNVINRGLGGIFGR